MISKPPAVLSAALIATTLCAHEPQSVHEEAPVHAEQGFYTALKGLITLGDNVEHGEGVSLEGSSGKGVGIEVGYKIGHGFAVEADGTFARNTVTEKNCNEHEEATEAHAAEEPATNGCHRVDADGEYTTVSLDLVYLLHLSHHFGAFVKTGFEYETESIEKLDISGNDTGVIYAVGAEYAVGEHTAFMAEYEGTTIEGPRGSSLFAGVVYHF